MCAAGTGFLLLCGFVAKPWVMFIAPLLVCEGLPKLRRRWSSVAVAAGSTALLIGAFAAWQWSRFGDPLHHITIAKPVAIFLPYSRDILLDNPRMLFLRNEYGSYFAGFYPHALVLLMVLLGHRLFAAGKWLAYFARTLPKIDRTNPQRAYEILMKYGPERNYWNEYIFEAYVNHRTELVFLAGLPDVEESRPHSKVNS